MIKIDIKSNSLFGRCKKGMLRGENNNNNEKGKAQILLQSFISVFSNSPISLPFWGPLPLTPLKTPVM